MASRERLVNSLYRLIHPDRARRVKRAKKARASRGIHRAPVLDEKPVPGLELVQPPAPAIETPAPTDRTKNQPAAATPTSYEQAVAEGKRRWESEWRQSVFGFLIATDAAGSYHALPPGNPPPGFRPKERFAPQRQGGTLRWRIDPVDHTGKAK